jgi:hypothetical protein
MRLELVLEADANAHSYRPGDRVRGELLIWGHRLKQSSEITAKLQGGSAKHHVVLYVHDAEGGRTQVD